MHYKVTPVNNSSNSSQPEYDRRYEGSYMDIDEYSVWARTELKARQVVETLQLLPLTPKHLLDYGCGVGGWIPVLSRVFPTAAISGVEISGTAVEKARLRYPQHDFQHLRGPESPFKSETFDLVFSYHVLEHVDDRNASVKDIARLIRPGGYACIIFPCGNTGSFLDRIMRLIKASRERSTTGESAFFFEIPDGHVRRLTSDETIELFRNNGLAVVGQRFSGHFFGTIDWLVRGTGPAYINRVFRGRPANSKAGQFILEVTRRSLIAIHRFLRYQSLDLDKRRNPLKQALVFSAKYGSKSVDALLSLFSSLEWRLLKHRKSGAAQYLIFHKV